MAMFEPDEWAAIENLAVARVGEARSLNVPPREHAATVHTLHEGFCDDVIHRAMAAARVRRPDGVGLTPMRVEPDITQAADLIAAWRGALDAATIAWLDQQSATLAEHVALSALIDAWHEDDDQCGDMDPDELLLGRLVVAMAIVFKVRPVRIEAD